jgi:predicted  nucleic acid-binding Zn-ribbon protein
MKFVCIMCGKVYEDDPTDLRKTVRVCSKACYRKHKNIQSKAYYHRKAEEARQQKAKEEAKKPVKKPPKYTMDQINEMARERGLTYGQMQGLIYCLDHPIRT